MRPLRRLGLGLAHQRLVQARSYEKALDRVAQVGSLHDRAGEPDGFDVYLADLRHRHWQKTKFIRLLDEAGLR